MIFCGERARLVGKVAGFDPMVKIFRSSTIGLIKVTVYRTAALLAEIQPLLLLAIAAVTVARAALLWTSANDARFFNGAAFSRGCSAVF